MNVNIDISKTTLKTERLILRPWVLSDLEDFHEYAKVDGVGQMAGWLPHENKEKSLEILKKFIDGKKTFAIEYQGKVIGSLGIEKYNESELPEFNDKRGRELGFVLSDLLTNYARISDHCSNIAVAMIEVAQNSFDTHEYLNSVKTMENEEFKKRFQKYREQYKM